MAIPVPPDHGLAVLLGELELMDIVLLENGKEFLVVAELDRLELPVVPLLDVDVLDVLLGLDEMLHPRVVRRAVHANEDAQVHHEVRSFLLLAVEAKFVESIAGHAPLEEFPDFRVLLQA